MHVFKDLAYKGQKILEVGVLLTKNLMEDEKIRNDLQSITIAGQLVVLGLDIAEKIQKKSETNEERLFGALMKNIFLSVKEVFEIERIENVSIMKIAEKKYFFEVFTKAHPYHHDYSIIYQPVIGEFFTKIRKLLKNKIDENKLDYIIGTIHTLFEEKIKNNEEITKFNNSFFAIKSTEKLIEYLKHIENKKFEHNEIDPIPLENSYVESKMALVSIEKWHSHDYGGIMDIGKRFDWPMFLDAPDTKRRLTLAGTFGMGKTATVKMLAADCASKCLANLSNPIYPIPILVNLNSKLDSVYGDLDLDDVLEEIVAFTENNKRNRKILIILDGLDEYPDNKENLIRKVENYWKTYKKLKIIFTTRLESGFPEILKIHKSEGQYVRIFPFDKSDVNNYFANYGITDISYDEISNIGLDEEEIRKPLFCWMMAVSKIKSNFLEKINENFDTATKKTVLYMEFMRSLFRGKHKSEFTDSQSISLFLVEKQILRRLAMEKQMFEEELYDDDIDKTIRLFYPQNPEYIKSNLKPIITSYFHLSQQKTKKKIDFIHRTFREYLLAEYYFENILNGEKSFGLNTLTPTKETIEFLEGIIGFIFNNKREEFKQYKNEFLEAFEFSSPKQDSEEKRLEKIKMNFCNNALSYVKNTQLACYAFEDSKRKTSERWHILDEKMDTYYNLWLHRWLALFCIKKIDPSFPIPKDTILSMIKLNGNFIPYYLKNFAQTDLSNMNLNNVDLSQSNISKTNFANTEMNEINLTKCMGEKANFEKCHLENSNLVLADLQQSIFNDAFLYRSNLMHANLSKAYLIRTNLKESILINSNLQEADLSGADLTDANLTGAVFNNSNLNETNLSNTKLTGSNFVKSNLSDSKLISANITETNLQEADLSGADLTDAILVRVNLKGTKLNNTRIVRTIISNVEIDESTDTRGIILTEMVNPDNEKFVKKTSSGNIEKSQSEDDEQSKIKRRYRFRKEQYAIEISSALERVDKKFVQKIISDNPDLKGYYQKQ